MGEKIVVPLRIETKGGFYKFQKCNDVVSAILFFFLSSFASTV